MVNDERAKGGLPPLGLDTQLNNSAQLHSEDQASRNTMDHTGSNGSSPGDRISAAGFSWNQVAENVAYGYKDMITCMNEWMNSPGHRENIMSPAYEMFGAGVADSGGTKYWTQDFGTDNQGKRNVPKCDGSDTGYGGGDAIVKVGSGNGNSREKSSDRYGNGEMNNGSNGGYRNGGSGGGEMNNGSNGSNGSYGDRGSGGGNHSGYGSRNRSNGYGNGRMNGEDMQYKNSENTSNDQGGDERRGYSRKPSQKTSRKSGGHGGKSGGHGGGSGGHNGGSGGHNGGSGGHNGGSGGHNGGSGGHGGGSGGHGDRSGGHQRL